MIWLRREPAPIIAGCRSSLKGIVVGPSDGIEIRRGRLEDARIDATEHSHAFRRFVGRAAICLGRSNYAIPLI